jgi:hypothetical protein
VVSRPAAIAAALVACAFGGSLAQADVVVEQDWNLVPPTGDGWTRYGGFTDYANGQAGTNFQPVNIDGNTWASYLVESNYYWGQLVGQNWANPNITVANMQANPILEFDVDLSQTNWGNLNLQVQVENKATSAGDQVGTVNYNASQLAIKNRQPAAPIVQHVSIDLGQMNLPIQSMLLDGTGDQNLLIYFQPQYYGFWDPTANGGAGAWIDNGVSQPPQTYRFDNVRLTTGTAKTNAAWNVDADGNWSDTSLWNSGTLNSTAIAAAPNGAGHTANFFHTKSDGGSVGSRTVTVDVPVTLGVLNFHNPSSQTISGSNAITFTGSSGVAPAINVTLGSHTVSAPVALTGNTAVTVSQASDTLSLTDLQPAGGATLTKQGAGTLAVNRVEAAGLLVDGGTVRVVESSPGLSSGHPAGDNVSVSEVASVSIANDGAPLGSRGYSGTLDLTNNDLIIDYTGASPVAAIEDMIRSGYNVTGDWAGAGITSSVAALDGNYVIAIADNALLAAPFGTAQGGAPFAGVDVDLDTVLVKFTHRADINLDGVITPDDSAIFGGNYDENQPATWATGDMNYDGIFTPDDAAIFGGAYDESLASLPEPASLSALAVLCLGLARRRRRARH